METSLFLAKFWGSYLIVFFLVLVFNPKRITAIFEYLLDKKFLLVTAFVAIIMGILNILFHNIWVSDWRLSITLIGWISLIVGIAFFTFPVKSAAWLQFKNVKFFQVLYVLLLFLGVFLLLKGYT
ncbi:hypothetical protein [Flagellimonas allohymeniacidonis]|uniref:Uncharacterized protein n=1 Tax=Flagellimonas allohymeniacidonis TaxID=2517819 RepID=A0A4Q8QFG7_9FLAO|nr:hypothetical protein [Allomuricauda hymeniacidonis]TAI48437.1 hypothetical protein EW142_01125 [Allomuricauda hymeniacidonis]